MKTVTPADGALLGTVGPREDSDVPPEQAAASAASGPEEDARPMAPPPAPGEAMLGLCDVAMHASARMAASRYKVEWNADVERLSKLSPDERATLGLFAPMAAPYFGRVVAYAPAIGAAAFGIGFALIVADHSKAIAALARKQEPKGRVDASAPAPVAPPVATGPPPHLSADAPPVDHNLRADGSKPTPEEITRHAQLWGFAKDAVPVGALPTDTGGFLPKPAA